MGNFLEKYVDPALLQCKESFYDDWVTEKLDKCSILLDAGCGSGDYWQGRESRFLGKKVIGIDISRESIAENKIISIGAEGNLSQIPLKDESVQLIICRSVFEHLTEPQSVWSEFARILKPGGYVIISTQNKYHPVMFLSYLFPSEFRVFLKKRLLNMELDEGTYPTHYKCNTKWAFEKMSKAVGFEEEYYIHHTHGHGYWKSPLLRKTLGFMEMILSTKTFFIFRAHIVACYRKPL
ncbi:MAG: class I SAM-dependent methyltransferase [Candidatus Schekmanbacteria bacterium]|nr:MAG: class I SAM-dependent methyltransferase [Candidatus Schekmanbacteria bacterium]